jgi:MarR family transcriptional regulator for hemolysin
MQPLGRQLYRTFRAMRERLDDDMRAAGASMSQWLVLKTVGDEPELSQRQLAERVFSTGSTLTHHLDRMEADGFITRSRDAHDRRVVRVALTREGKQRRAELDAVVTARDGVLESLLSARQATTLNRLLAELERRLLDHEDRAEGAEDAG